MSSSLFSLEPKSESDSLRVLIEERRSSQLGHEFLFMGIVKRFNGWETQKDHMKEGEPDLMRGDIFIIPSTIDRKLWIEKTESGD